MITTPEGRWPPIYDAEGLDSAIRALITSVDFDSRFWDLRELTDVCQGDVVELASTVPLIDELGEAVATDDCDRWLVIGNTCDFARDLKDCAWTQLVPLVTLGVDAESRLKQLRAYNYSRAFYVPPWPQGDRLHRLADFTRPVAAHKGVFNGVAKVIARMQYPAWVLLHSCLIRFIARDDGRFDQ